MSSGVRSSCVQLSLWGLTSFPDLHFPEPLCSFCTMSIIMSFCSTVIQFSSVAQSCPTLCDPMNRSTPGLPVHHQLPEFTQTHAHWVSDAIQPSRPLSSPSPPAPNPSQHQSLFQWVNSSHEVAKVPTPVFLPGESQGWGAWWAAVYEAAQSWTRLKRLSSSSSRLLIDNLGVVAPSIQGASIF